jgi:hypothetical protein
MEGFEIRRRSVAMRGKFVSSAELRSKFAGADINDVFLINGLNADARGCKVEYFVNGVLWVGGSEWSDNNIPTQANAYEAVEFYPSALLAPIDIIGAHEFSAGLCGVYVLWLREP